MNRIVWLLILSACFVGFIVSFAQHTLTNGQTLLRQIEQETDEEKQQILAVRLTKLVGPKQAIELLNASPLPKAGKSHLLAHKVGETAFELYGEDALSYCEEDMRSGCSHGLLTRAVRTIGFEGVKRMVENCKKWSFFRYTMCIHAAGHAFLAFTAYDIFPALDYCDRLIDPTKSEIRFCYNGLFMENSHGVHDGIIPPLHPYLSKTDLMKPCNIVEKQYQQACYKNIAGWWYADVFERDLERTVKACDDVPTQYYLACIDNVARVISTIDENNLSKMRESCGLFSSPHEDECLSSIAISLSSQGEEILPVELCTMVGHPNIKKSCYSSLVEDYTVRGVPEEKKKAHCSRFERAYIPLCQR